MQHHLLHLPGHSRDRIYHFALVGTAEWTDQPCCCAGHRGIDTRSCGHICLTLVVLRHVATAAPEHGFDLGDDSFIADQFHPHHRGDRLAGYVVLGGPQTTANDYCVAATKGLLKYRDHAIQIVADFCLVMAVDAHQRQLLTNPRRVGVDDLTQQQLSSDRHDFTVHRRSLDHSPVELSALWPSIRY